MDNPKSNDFIFGQMCSYEISWPEDATEYDEIVLSVLSLEEGATVYATDSPDLFDSESDLIQEQLLSSDSKVTIKHPNSLYVTA